MNEENRQHTWFFPVDSISPFYKNGAYIDTPTYLADRIFDDVGIKVSKLSVFYRDDSPFRIVYCRYRRKDEKKFMQAMELLPSKALVCGWYDYLTYADRLFTDMQELREQQETEEEE